MGLITIIPILTKSLGKTVARHTELFIVLASIKTKISNIRAYLLFEENKKQQAIINDLTRRLALKDKIISIISHDVRSPLDSLKSLLELLSAGKVSQHEFHEITSHLNQQVGQLAHFMEDLLKWIRNLTTDVKPHFEQIFIHRLVREIVGLFALQAQRKQVDLQSQISSSTIVYADKEMVKLVLRNLINNAIKFCKPGDRILVNATEYLGEVRISVEDTGQGIARESISKLFEVSHLSTAGTKSETGTGLGLNLCKEFVEKMGGKISVTSREGHGSKFEFTIHSPSTPRYEFQKFIDGHDSP